MIPKKIHYCWFGRNPKPELAKKCLKSWKKYCRGYEIIEWNEDNYDLSKAPLYVRQAYAEKKWAFVTDYVRLQIVYEQGGIYMDTDVELRKCPDKLLNHQAFFGFESEKYIATGLGFGAVKGCQILKEMMDDYLSIPFVLPDGSYDLVTCPVRNTEVFLKHGLRQDNSMQILEGDILILPKEYLAPIDTNTNELQSTVNTISIHWFSGSWCSEEEQKARDECNKWIRRRSLIEFLSGTGKRVLGDRFYTWLRDRIKRFL